MTVRGSGGTILADDDLVQPQFKELQKASESREAAG